MFTKNYDDRLTIITFTEAITHRFNYVTYCNIIFGIEQLSTDYFIDAYREELEVGVHYGFPICAKNCEELKECLNKEVQKIFEISTLLGLVGFVIAKDISIEVTTV